MAENDLDGAQDLIKPSQAKLGLGLTMHSKQSYSTFLIKYIFIVIIKALPHQVWGGLKELAFCLSLSLSEMREACALKGAQKCMSDLAQEIYS